jgi:hypothetical protein
MPAHPLLFYHSTKLREARNMLLGFNERLHRSGNNVTISQLTMTVMFQRSIYSLGMLVEMCSIHFLL